MLPVGSPKFMDDFLISQLKPFMEWIVRKNSPDHQWIRQLLPSAARDHPLASPGLQIAGNSWDDLSKHAINSNSGYDDMVIPRINTHLKKTIHDRIKPYKSSPDGKVVLTIKLGILLAHPGMTLNH